jgi:hypothetical protein
MRACDVLPPLEPPAGRGAWRRLLPGTLAAAALAAALAAGGWLGARWYVRSVLRDAPLALAESSARPGGSDADLARVFERTDWLPDWAVYPALAEAARRPYGGAYSEGQVALRMIQLRAHGGCRALLGSGGPDLPESARPVPGAERWVALLPRQLVEDLYAVSHPAPPDRPVHVSRDESGRPVLVGDILSVPHLVSGDRLIRVLDPDDPRWRQPSPPEEVAAAHARLRVWAMRD